MKTLFTIIFLLFIAQLVQAQGQRNPFHIEQRDLPSGGFYSHHYNGEEILVQKGFQKKKRPFVLI